MKFTIDATGKKLGRVASEAAVYLLGKHAPTFAKNKVADVHVEIINASKATIDEKKQDTKEYITYTGYRGGLKNETLGHLIGRKGYKDAFTRAVYRMLPGNTLRSKRMKNLNVTE